MIFFDRAEGRNDAQTPGGEKEKFVVGGKLDWEDIKGTVMGIVG